MAEVLERRRNGGHPRAPEVRHLAPWERDAALELVRRVRERVPAEVVQAFVFGSKARGEARPDSDVDVLLVFRELPPDREPHAGHAEEIAEEVAEESGIPVTVWSVSLVDLSHGNRTPMLVDALEDGVPLWPVGAPPVRVCFTPEDALRCVDALLQRIDEGGDELAELLHEGRGGDATRRVRDDLVRMCIAAFLLEGETRPRRGEAARSFVERFVETGEFPPGGEPVFRWAAESYGPLGNDEEWPLLPPPGGLRRAAALVEELRRWIGRRAAALELRLAGGEPAPPANGSGK